MSCPDNLLIGHRRGALSDQDRARLESHLGGCPTCRLTLQVGSDFDQVLDTVPGDDLIAARFARELLPKVPKVAQVGAARGGGMRRFAWVAAAVFVLMAGGGLAAAMVGGAWPFARREASVPAEQSDGRALRRPVARPAVPRELPEETVEPSTDTQGVGKQAPRRAPRADELFAQANVRRREGEARRARGLYRQLQQLYPRSAEAVVSHVSLGRVHLTLAEPRDALEQFELYLTKLPRGPLSEEALFGKASALERLGQSADERRTWQALLAAYPGSVYADRARHRLELIP